MNVNTLNHQLHAQEMTGLEVEGGGSSMLVAKDWGADKFGLHLGHAEEVTQPRSLPPGKCQQRG